jgi:hypothetical protein
MNGRNDSLAVSLSGVSHVRWCLSPMWLLVLVIHGWVSAIDCDDDERGAI